MKINNIFGFAFSPTGGTYKITENILKGMDSENIKDITSKIKEQELNSDDIVIFSVPVFGGRVPDIALQRIKSLKANKTFAVPVVVYGNREYDDALLELKNTLEENNFKVIAGAAFISKHSIATTIAANRPSDKDKEIAINFGKDIIKKINNSEEFNSIDVPGNIPYREYNGVPLKPKTKKSCISCGICAEKCPVNAIPKDNPKLTDKDKCITCMHCIDVCPKQSRQLNRFLVKVTTKKLLKACDLSRMPELFL